MRQFFYLVCINYDESTYPQKIFLQEQEAISWGRREATKALKEGYCNYEYVLYEQVISRTGLLRKVRPLLPFKGSDFDIDKLRNR